MYIVVADVEKSAAICRERGGEVLVEPRPLGHDRFCVIKDPAGAVAALYERHRH
jgi:predicted enzyme related to lactoylglutathione lyase